MFKQIAKQATKGREEGQGLVEYALILVLVAVVVIVVLLQLGPAVGNVFSEVMDVLEGGTSQPQDGDVCVDFHEEGGTPWHYIWEYQTDDWVRIAEPGGTLPICDFSRTGNNGTRTGGTTTG